MREKQQRQEQQYVFPYHHLTSTEDGFTQSRNLFWGYEYISYVDFIVQKLGELSFSSIIDVGCGDGKLLHELSKSVHDSKMVGLDYSARALSFAKGFNPQLEFICADITSLSDKDLVEKFDAATLIEVLEHIPVSHVPRFIESFSSLLQKDALAIVTVPSINIHRNKKHYQHFDRKGLGTILEKHFRIKEVLYLNKRGLVSSVIRHLLSNRLFILNEKRLRNMLYRVYKKTQLHTDEKNCSRIFVLCEKI